jgi:hypothetical protein
MGRRPTPNEEIAEAALANPDIQIVIAQPSWSRLSQFATAPNPVACKRSVIRQALSGAQAHPTVTT